MKLVIEVDELEAVAVRALVHTNGVLFAIGKLHFENGAFAYEVSETGKLLNALQGLNSYQTAGSGSQKLFGKVLRSSASLLN